MPEQLARAQHFPALGQHAERRRQEQYRDAARARERLPRDDETQHGDDAQPSILRTREKRRAIDDGNPHLL